MPPKTNGHSLIGGSSLKRAMECPPSVRLTEDFEDEGSVYAQEGSEAHLLLEKKIKERFGIPYKIGIPIGGEDIDVTDEIEAGQNSQAEVLIMGERVSSLSLAKYLTEKTGNKCMGYAATDSDEDEIINIITNIILNIELALSKIIL